MGALAARIRESVATSDAPQLKRGQDEPEDEKEGTEGEQNGKKAKRSKKRKTTESLHILIREADLHRNGGAYEATVLREGAGNPGHRNYYTKQALRQAVSDRMFEGLHAYANHPTASEERDRPERDVRQLVGHFREARYVEEGGKARVMAKFMPITGPGYEWVTSLIESALQTPADNPLIGISIDGFGHAPDQQDIGGRTYNMVREIAHLGSADIVTRAGAGGQFHRRLQESMRLTEAKLSGKQRKAMKQSDFAIPEKAPGPGSYPIPDESHARDALSRVAANGTSEEKSRVRAAVRRKFPGIKVSESNPAAQAGTSQEGRMKPAELQEKIKGAVSKLREASKLEDGDQAEAKIEEALIELEECATAEVKRSRKVEIREVEKPVAAGDSDADQIAAELADTQRQLREAQSTAETERSKRKDAESKVDTYERGKLAEKTLREASVPEASARAWFEDVVRCDGADAMKALVQRRMDERESILAEIRESTGVEGAPARMPAMTGAATGGGLLEAMGINRDELGS